MKMKVKNLLMESGVVIEQGNHTMKEPRYAKKVLAILFSEAGFNPNKMKVQMGEGIPCSETTPMIVVCELSKRKSVILKVHSDGSNSRYKYFAFPPSGITPENFRLRLFEASERINSKPKSTPVEPIVETPVEPIVPIVKTPVEPIVETPITIFIKEKKNKSVSTNILSDETMIRVVVESIRDHTNNGLIRRNKIIELLEEMKLNCDSKYILISLIKRGLLVYDKQHSQKKFALYRVSPTRIPVLKNTKETDMLTDINEVRKKFDETVKESNMEVKKTDTSDTTKKLMSMVETLEVDAERYNTRLSEIKCLEERVVEIKGEITKIEKIIAEKTKETSSYLRSINKLSEIKRILGI